MKSICATCNIYKTISQVIRYDEMCNHKYLCGRCNEIQLTNKRRKAAAFRPHSRPPYRKAA